jgi:hypothetical protein
VFDDKITSLDGVLKGFLRTLDLKPLKSDQGWTSGDYFGTMRFFESDGDDRQLYYRKQELHRFIDKLSILYPDQIDKRFASHLLVDLACEWIENGYQVEDQDIVTELLSGYLHEIEENIKTYSVYIPISGLKLGSNSSIRVGQLTLRDNIKDSEMGCVIQRARYVNESVKKAPAFAKLSVLAHRRHAMEKAKEIAEETLDVLRLYLGSHYYDIYANSRSMGITGTLPGQGVTEVYYTDSEKPLDNQIPGCLSTRDAQLPYELADGAVKSLNALGLSRLNSLFEDVEETNLSKSTELRLYRAVSWFSRGTTASKIAESYLMYAIAAEALLSEGRTPKADYAKWIAGLVTRGEEQLVYPVGGGLSKAFLNRIKNDDNVSERFNTVRKHVIGLFGYRDNIAHGQILDQDIDPLNLLDFETLVRNSILSFLIADWEAFDDFKQWFEESAHLHFSPKD